MEEKSHEKQENLNNKTEQKIEQNTPCKDENLVKEIEAIKKRQKFLKILSITLFVIVLGSVLSVYLVYKKFSNMFNVSEEAFESYMEPKSFFGNNSLPALPSSNVSNFQQNITNQPQSSLSKISFGKEVYETLSDEESRKEINETVERFKNDPGMKNFFEEVKNDPELKELFSDPSNPAKVFEKMKDPNFANKLVKKLMQNPQALSAIMKMAQDPSFQKVMSKFNPNNMPFPDNVQYPAVSQPLKQQAVENSGKNTNLGGKTKN